MSKFDSFKLRMSLLNIWAIKNIPVFFKVAAYVLVVLVMTGQVSSDTPIIRVIPGVVDLSTAIRNTLSEDYRIGDTWGKLLSSGLTLLITIGTFSAGMRSIALADIKNIDLKRTLVRAGFYFNKDGRLVKRIEEATRMDIDGDSQIGDTGMTISQIKDEKLVDGISRAGKEFAAIITADLKSEDHANEVLQKTDLVETKAAATKVVETIKTSAVSTSSQQISDTINEKTGTKVAKPSMVKRAFSSTGIFIKKTSENIASFFKKLFARKPKKEKKKKVKEVAPVAVQQPAARQAVAPLNGSVQPKPVVAPLNKRQ
jgi:hypothetical protein